MATKRLLFAALFAVMLTSAPAQVKASGFTGDFGIEDGNFVEQHIHNFATSTTPASCTAEGQIVTSCSCGESSSEVIPALGHEWGVPVTVPASCTEAGSVTTTCTRCQYADVQVLEPGHNWNTVSADATCTDVGGVTTTCTICGAVDHAEEIPALGHEWGTPVTVGATTTEDGSITTTCTRCQYADVQVLPATGVEDEGSQEPTSPVVPVVPTPEQPVAPEEEPNGGELPLEDEATYSQREKVVVSEGVELEEPREFSRPLSTASDLEEPETPMADARPTSFGLWWLLPLILLILLCHQYHLVLVARNEQGEEDVTVLMFTWSVKKVMERLAKLKGTNPEAELKIIHFFRGKGKRLVYSWSKDGEKSEFMSHHEAKVAETVLGFVYCADDEAEEDTSAEAEAVA